MIATGIYQIQSNIRPERIYIGSAVNMQNRWYSHLSKLRRGVHDNNKLQGHFNKYGENDLIFSVIICCDKEDLIKHEQFYIDALNPSFNMSRKAGSMLGYKHTEETKRKISLIQKGKPKPHKGVPHTEEQKRKLSESNKGKHFRIKTPEEIEKNRIAHLGKIPWNKGRKGISKMSIETREKMRLSAYVGWNKRRAG